MTNPPVYTRFYMRENHTFCKLDPDDTKAYSQLVQELLEDSYYGMLATKDPKHRSVVQNYGPDDTERFLQAAAEWLRNTHNSL